MFIKKAQTRESIDHFCFQHLEFYLKNMKALTVNLISN